MDFHQKYKQLRNYDTIKIMIYFIAEMVNGRCERIKIGESDDPNSRLNQLQTGNSNQLRLLKVLPGNTIDEKDLHKKFSEYRVSGEWFSFEGRLAEFLNDLSLKRPQRTAIADKAVEYPDTVVDSLETLLELPETIVINKPETQRRPLKEIILFLLTFILSAAIAIWI